MPERLPATGPAGEPGDSTTLLGRPAAPYLDQAAGALAAVKAEILRRLAPAPGQRILDVGCGNGTDVLEIARLVGGAGEAVGVDVNAEAVAGATGRAADAAVPVSFQVAEAGALPFRSDRFDACRSERMVQHVPDPVAAVREMARVTVPDGRVLVMDPDHGMWAPDLADRETVRAVLAWWFDNVLNPWMGRRLPGVLRAAGLADVQVTVMPVVLHGVAAADGLTGIMDALAKAGDAGVIPADRARALLAEAGARDAEGGFVMYGAMVLAEGRKPG